MNFEQARRDLKRDNPDLYAYIRAFEVAKALDSAGDTASGSLDGHHAANRIWREAAQQRHWASELRAEGRYVKHDDDDHGGAEVPRGTASAPGEVPNER